MPRDLREAGIRNFVDAILAFIETASLNDDEYAMIEETDQEYTVELYTQVMLVLDSRETVSSTRDRLTAYFTARGVAVTEPSAGSSKIFIGSGLCS